MINGRLYVGAYGHLFEELDRCIVVVQGIIEYEGELYFFGM